MGSYLGLEGHIIQATGNIFDICQEATQEVVQVSKYYLDRCPPNYTYQSWSSIQQHFEHHPDESLQVGDYIKVLFGEHIGKCRVVAWFPAGETQLWLQYANPWTKDDTGYNSGTPIFQVPTTFVWRTGLSQTLKYTKEKGYDVRPGDVIDVPIDFMMKIRNISLDSFKDVIGQEVFVIGGDRKGYRATLYSIGSESCTVAVHGQAHTECKHQDVATRFTTPPPDPVPSGSSSSTSADPSLSSSTWTNWCTSFMNINTTHDPSSTDMQDNISAGTNQPKDNVFRVSLSFMGGRLHKQFVSMACPDPFCSANGPAPEDCVAVFCTSSNTGAAIQHYHIHAKDLSPAPPCKKTNGVSFWTGNLVVRY
ncbi:hypothetical protein C8R48DRAFT_672090 [Suillus tomentosus]|nr:hypothetical protein C8R48DRAFT_672090 [Suillus tomentosus]